MKVLIIGSEGFIGGHAVSFFRSAGFQVVGCDTSAKPSSEYTYYCIDKKSPDYNTIFSSHPAEVCINASGNSNVFFSTQEPVQDFSANTLTTLLVMEAIRQYQPTCKFINLSSAAVYGNPQQLPITEQSPVQPVSPYGWHKYYTELICKEYHTLYGIACSSLRIFSVYGPGMRKQIFWDIYQKTIGQKVVILFGTGKESRDFIFIDDLLNAVEAVIAYCPMKAEVINVSSGVECTIREAANQLLTHLNPTLQLQFSGESRPGDPINWRADITQLTALGFQYSTTIEKGLHLYAQWLKENESA